MNNNYPLTVFHENRPVVLRDEQEWSRFAQDFRIIHAAGGIVSDENDEILMIFRYGCWDFPKGKVEEGEDWMTAAVREVEEETSVVPASLMSIGMFSAPGRDPRGWIISNAFVSVIGSSEESQVSGDDAADARWFDVSFEQEEDGRYILGLSRDDISIRAVLTEKSGRFGMSSFDIVDSGSIAFDHAAIIARALTALRSSAKDFDIIFDFLPEKFTLTELQNVQETVLNISVLSANFRRKVSTLVEETDEYTEGAGHRPAKLFKRK